MSFDCVLLTTDFKPILKAQRLFTIDHLQFFAACGYRGQKHLEPDR